ncbi:MAG: hypothetical protein IPO21_20315 [Bacteroidales bacterium]|nr:hypothetical protein [Bacteroidales bacterium]
METTVIQKTYLSFGVYTSLLLSIITIITFGFAMTAIPPAGSYCPANCMTYPFPDILLYYPRDYYWMYLAIFQLFVFVIFGVTNHFVAQIKHKLFSFLSVVFTVISATVLLITYFTQFSVVPISVMKGETEGIALLTQYNEHGLFIAMEELGYIAMSIALFFLAFAFSKDTKKERIIRVILIIQFILTIAAFIYYSVMLGLERGYQFEVATITINWLAIIIVGFLIGSHYKKQAKLIR